MLKVADVIQSVKTNEFYVVIHVGKELARVVMFKDQRVKGSSNLILDKIGADMFKICDRETRLNGLQCAIKYIEDHINQIGADLAEKMKTAINAARVDVFKEHIEYNATTQGFFGHVIQEVESWYTWEFFGKAALEAGVNTLEELDEFLKVKNYFFNGKSPNSADDIKTLYGWRLAGKPFSEYCLPYSRISADVYQYFLEILPPFYHAHGFAVSEPFSVDYKLKEETYAHFARVGHDFYFLGDIARSTVEQAYQQLLKTI